MSETTTAGGGGDEGTFDDDRQLCEDGNCLGVIVGGTCNVCGLAAAASSPRDPSSGQTGGNAPTSSPRDPSSGQTGGLATKGGDDDAFDGDDRQLCPDGACTGLLGSDGKCKVCGRSAAS